MIITASRRTDIPAFYSRWFMNRIRAGYCTNVNPFNQKSIVRISLLPQDLDCIVFVTRNPQALLPHIPELDARGFRYYFYVTLMDNPRPIELHTPALPIALDRFKRLSDAIGPEKVIWRYDPIVISTVSGVQFHLDKYAEIAQALRGYTRRSVISIIDFYAKQKARLAWLETQGVVLDLHFGEGPQFEELSRGLVSIAARNSMRILSCAETLNLEQFGVERGSCIDGQLIRDLFGVAAPLNKDSAQRKECACVPSRDIGMYDMCLFGCQYCYATTSFDRAAKRHHMHDPDSPSLLGHHEVPENQLRLL